MAGGCTSPIPFTKLRNEGGKHAHKHRDASDPIPGKYTTNFGKGYHDLARHVACGQCRHCRKRKASDWSIRTFHESTLHEVNLFVTLSFDPEHRPFPPNPDLKIHQLFMKRLRKRLGHPVRFSNLREHGKFPKYRPHMHTILFDCNPGDLKWRPPSRRGNFEHSSELLSEIWGQGNIHIGAVNPASSAYAQAHNKLKITGKAQALAYNNTVDTVTGALFDRDPPAIHQSNRPGLGHGWFDLFKEDLWNSGSVTIGGHQVAIPRYYLRLMDEEEPERFQAFASKRHEEALVRRAKNPEENTPERRDVRDEVLKRQQAHNHREDVL